jgi:hypothetical protein
MKRDRERGERARESVRANKERETERVCVYVCVREREREKEILSRLAFLLGPLSCLALYKDGGSAEERVGERVGRRHAGRESFSE